MGLSLNNICIGNKLIFLSTCDSTNVYAKNLMAKSEPIEGVVIIAEDQSHGRGQIGNSWQSEKGKNLTFSILLKPNFLSITHQFMLSKIVSLACVETLEHFSNKTFSIKWPNDIFFESKKIGGILIENIISNSKLRSSILGIGLNVNQETFDQLPQAISLKNIANKEFDLDEVLAYLLKCLDIYYLKLRNSNFDFINKSYLNKMLGFETKRIFNEKGHLFYATIKGVTTTGQLILETETKEKKTFGFKEIAWHF